MDKPNYQTFDHYLKTVFSLIEGKTSVEKTFNQLHDYLRWHQRQKLDPKLESFLIKLFFDKCHKEFKGPELQK